MDSGIVQIIIALIGILAVGAVSFVITKRVKNKKDKNKMGEINQTIIGYNNNQAGRDINNDKSK